MASWTDDRGRTWTVTVTLDVAREVLSRYAGVMPDEWPARVVRDPVFAADLLAACCASAWAQQGETVAAMHGRLRGDSAGRAAAALLEALTDFFPPPLAGVAASLRQAYAGATSSPPCAPECPTPAA